MKKHYDHFRISKREDELKILIKKLVNNATKDFAAPGEKIALEKSSHKKP